MKRGAHKSEIMAIRRLVEALGGVCNVLHQSGRVRGSAGVPDLYVQMPGAVQWAMPATRIRPFGLWIEVKVGRDRLSPAQRAFGDRELSAGREWICGGLWTVVDYFREKGFCVAR